MSKKVKYLSYAIAIVLVAGIMTVAIWAATSASAGISANVSWTASAGIEFELEAWVVNNPAGNGIGNTTTPKSITKQIVTASTSNSTANNLAGDLACSFYDGTPEDGVNNPSNIVFTYKIKNTGNEILKVTATKTPNNQAESGTTAENHKPAVALSSKLDSTDNTSSCISSITGSGFNIPAGKTLEYIVTLSISNADLSITSFDAGVTFSFGVVQQATASIYVNGVQQTNVASASTVGDYLDALDGSQYPGYFYDEDLTIYADEDDIVTNDTKLYTKPATLDKLTFTSNGDGTCSVGAMNTSIEGEVVIPSLSPAGDKVISIGESAFAFCENLEGVILSNGLINIEDGAFQTTIGITSIIIPNSVTTIGDYAFNECWDLTSIQIGEGVSSIGEAVFNDAPISNLTVVNGNEFYDSRNNCNALIETSTNTLIKGCNTSFIPYGITSIGDNAFSSCYELLEIEIPDSVISIGERAFNECGSLTSVTIPDSVPSIGYGAFSNCSGLTSVTIGDSVTSIGDGAFSLCISLTSITIPDSVTSIGARAFSNCISLTSIYIPSSVTTISTASSSNSPFLFCSSTLKIYCGASSEPSGWEGDWNYYDLGQTLSVTWGVTRAEYDALYS